MSGLYCKKKNYIVFQNMFVYVNANLVRDVFCFCLPWSVSKMKSVKFQNWNKIVTRKMKTTKKTFNVCHEIKKTYFSSYYCTCVHLVNILSNDHHLLMKINLMVNNTIASSPWMCRKNVKCITVLFMVYHLLTQLFYF